MARNVPKVALLAAALLVGCVGPTEDDGPFTPRDLVGTWDRLSFFTNDNAGWKLETLTVDALGQVAFSACEATNPSACPNTKSPIYEIDWAGNVTASGPDGNPTLHATMRSRKDLMVGLATNPGSGPFNNFQLMIYRRRGAAVFTAADVANLAFTFHSLRSGSQSAWDRGTGTTDGLGAVTWTSGESSTGAPPAPPATTLGVNADGFVTMSGDPTYRGFMTADKGLVFGVRTLASGAYAFTVNLRTGGVFTQADLRGRWAYHSLNSGVSVSNSGWGRGVFSADAGGAVTFLEAYNPAGAQVSSGFTVAVAPDGSGSLGRAGYPSYRGQLAPGNDVMVRTQTQQGTGTLDAPNGPPSLSINVR